MATITKMPLKKPSAYKTVLNKATGRGEVWLYGSIGVDWFGDGVTAKQFAEDLKKLGAVDAIDLRINSDGGVVTDARAIYNQLVEHKATVTSHIDGIAASAASFVAMAGDEISIAEGGFIMVHNARGLTIGDANEHRAMAGILDQVNQTIINTYVARTGQPEAQIKKWMNAETWMDGKDAIANGFADRMVENKRIAASLDHWRAFRRIPIALRPHRNKAIAAIAGIKQAIPSK